MDLTELKPWLKDFTSSIILLVSLNNTWPSLSIIVYASLPVWTHVTVSLLNGSIVASVWAEYNDFPVDILIRFLTWSFTTTKRSVPAKEMESYLKDTTCLPVDTSKTPHLSLLLSFNANKPLNLSISPAS